MSAKQFQISRRRFVQNTAALAGGLGLPGWFLAREEASAAPKPLSPNDRPGIALVGCGGQGSGDCHGARSFGDVVAVCDVDLNQAQKAAEAFKSGDKKPVIYRDFRKLMERDDVHVIITGTPDHWHTMVNLLAVRTGKDVYTEKPLTLCIDEGKRLVQAVRDNNRIVQVGSQQRSDRNFRLACELTRNQRLGQLQHIIVGLPTGPREGPFKALPVPFELNWDCYLGQAAYFPYNGHNTHWNFRWWYAFSGGQMTDWGAHHNDIAQWGNGTERSGPVSVEAKSLVAMIPDGYETASRYRAEYRYANGVAMSVVDESTITEHNVVGEGKSTPNGVQFIGTEGWIYVSRSEIRASKPELLDTPLPAGAVRLYKSDNHMANFFECVRSRKDPICDVEIGYRSVSVAHLGNISMRLGRPLKWDPAQAQFVGDAEANQWLRREMRKPYDWSLVA